MEPTTPDHGRDPDQPTTNQPGDHAAPAPERLTPEEAAARLGISVNAVRQRIKRGTLAADRSVTPWSVLWSTDRPTSDQPSDRPTTSPTDRHHQVALLEAQLDAVTSERDLLRDRVQELTHTNLALVSRLPAGTVAPKGVIEAAAAAPDGPGATQAAPYDTWPIRPEPERPSAVRQWWNWWKRRHP